MGLDITYYEQLKKADNPVDDESGWETGLMRPHINPDFPGRADGLEPGWYLDDDAGHFRAGSYGGYNEWRNQLSLAVRDVPAREVWDGPEGGPMYELIHFSDCEGVIGPVVSAKLAKDFEECRERVVAAMGNDDYFMQKYDAWEAAFKAASNGGCVRFH